MPRVKLVKKHATLEGKIVCNKNIKHGWRIAGLPAVDCKRCLNILNKGVQQKLNLMVILRPESAIQMELPLDLKPVPKPMVISKEYVWLHEEFLNR